MFLYLFLYLYFPLSLSLCLFLFLSLFSFCLSLGLHVCGFIFSYFSIVKMNYVIKNTWLVLFNKNYKHFIRLFFL